MWSELYQQWIDFIIRFFDKGILLVSFILGLFLNQIGYPKQIIAFIVVLTIIDLITKHLSVVVVNYGSLSFSNYYKAWVEKALTSRQLKNGLFLKTIMYACLLYIANQLGIIDGVLFGSEISCTLYNAIILVEISSILENGINMGSENLISIRDFIKNKYKQLMDLDKNKN